MKNLINRIAFVVLLAMISFNCNNKLNIEPAQNIDASQALLTSKDVQGALIGAYNYLGGGSSGDLYYGGIQVYGDLLAYTSDFSFFGTYQGLSQINNKVIPVNNNFVASVWLEGYAAINLTNEVLNSLNVVSPALKDQVEGEAKFIRACVYFELVKLFAKTYTDGNPARNPGVPIILTPTHSLSDAEAKPSRNSVAEVYTQIINDLNDAEAKLATPDNVTYYFATPGAAAAMLSRVYLMQNDYPNALSAADRVISSGFYKLTNTYAEEFPYTGRGVRIFNTSEDIFAIQVSEQSGVNNMNTYYASSDKGGRGDIEADSAFLATYDPNDQRARMYLHDDTGDVFQNGDYGVTYY
ncbi:MAG TPA: RagB/SusD family nutrient uptake outer membrane protein, partial [Cytophagales bacterium]|nr:RagB/SusD family nutrient uptake outer membrane protein [Cytophagales bacterium]